MKADNNRLVKTIEALVGWPDQRSSDSKDCDANRWCLANLLISFCLCFIFYLCQSLDNITIHFSSSHDLFDDIFMEDSTLQSLPTYPLHLVTPSPRERDSLIIDTFVFQMERSSLICFPLLSFPDLVLAKWAQRGNIQWKSRWESPFALIAC